MRVSHESDVYMHTRVCTTPTSASNLGRRLLGQPDCYHHLGGHGVNEECCPCRNVLLCIHARGKWSRSACILRSRTTVSPSTASPYIPCVAKRQLCLSGGLTLQCSWWWSNNAWCKKKNRFQVGIVLVNIVIAGASTNDGNVMCAGAGPDDVLV